MAEAERIAERVTWPDALAELALAKAALARGRGDAGEARRQIEAARALLGAEAERAYMRAITHDLLGYVTEDLEEARAHHAAAVAAAVEAGHPLAIASALVGVADLALRRDRPDQAARLLAAAAGLRGLPDAANPDVARIAETARGRLGDAGYAEAAREGTGTDWAALAEVTLAS
jgi:hypothetical protein